MTILKLCAVLAVLMMMCAAEVSGAAFINLNFEAATVKDTQYGYASTAAAIPGWSLRTNLSNVTTVEYGAETVDGATLAVLYSSYCTNGTPPISGKYSLLMRRGAYAGNSISLSQTGDIPSASKSLRFTARDTSGSYYGNDLPGPLQLTMNDSSVPIVALSRSGFDVQFGADVTAFTGQSVALTLTLTGSPITAQNTYGFAFAALDDFVFSSSTLPETNLTLIAALIVAFIAGRSRGITSLSPLQNSQEDA